MFDISSKSASPNSFPHRETPREIRLSVSVCRSDNSIVSSHVDATDALTVLDLEAHIACLTPVTAPIVAHDPVLGAARRVNAEADKDDGVVKFGRAERRVKDSSLVLKEWCA